MIRYLVLLLGVPFAVSAATITVDFEGFPDSTLLSNQYPGVTFSNTIVLAAGISLNEFEFPPHSGSNVASDNGGPISIDFATPVLSFGGFFTYAEPLTLQAFDAGNQQVGSVVSAFLNNMALSGDPGSSPNEFLQVSFASGISSVIITGDPAGGSFTLDDASYSTGTTSPSQTPEPTGMVLVGTGLLLVGLLRRHSLASLVRLGVGVIFLSATSYVAVAQNVGVPGVTPGAVNVNAPTTITVTSRITAANVIAGSVNVQKLSSAGQVLAIVGTLHDDGLDPDLLAGDGVYAGTVALDEPQAGNIGLRVSAATRGSLLRIASAATNVAVLPSGVPTGPTPADFSKAVTDPSSGTLLIGNEVDTCFTDATTLSSILSTVTALNASVIGRLSGLGNCYQLGLPAAASGAAGVQAVINTLEARSDVLFALPRTVISLLDAVPTCTDIPTCTDPHNIGYNHLQLNLAHSISTGAGVTIAEVDTPVDASNPFLRNRVRSGPRPSYLGPPPSDGLTQSHGTEVAGVIAATSPSSIIYSIPYVDEAGQTTPIDLPLAILLAAESQASVINLSSSVNYPYAVDNRWRHIFNLVVSAVQLMNKVLVVSAGNNPLFLQGSMQPVPTLPGAFSTDPVLGTTTLSVGGTNGNDVRASTVDWGKEASEFGPWVQIAAPGTCILTTDLDESVSLSGPCSPTPPPNGEIFDSGNSISVPFVAGSAALLWSLHPTWTATQIVQRLKDTAKPLNPNPTTTNGGNANCAMPSAPCPIDRSYNQQLGAGLIDPVNALYNCTLTLQGTVDSAPPGSLPEFSANAVFTGIFRYNSALPALPGFCNSQGCAFLGSFEISAGSHVWKGQSQISAGQFSYGFDELSGTSSLSTDGQYRLYSFDWQFQGGGPYPFSLLTNKAILDVSFGVPPVGVVFVKSFLAKLNLPGSSPNAVFGSYNVGGTIQSTALSCTNP